MDKSFHMLYLCKTIYSYGRIVKNNKANEKDFSLMFAVLSKGSVIWFEPVTDKEYNNY